MIPIFGCMTVIESCTPKRLKVFDISDRFGRSFANVRRYELLHHRSLRSAPQSEARSTCRGSMIWPKSSGVDGVDPGTLDPTLPGWSRGFRSELL